MTIYDRLAARAAPVHLVPQETSYFSPPEDHLDPALFDGDRLRGKVRQRLLRTIHTFLGTRYRNVDEWLTVYLAGSGVSYQWSAAREPGDLDVLLNVNWVEFRRANQNYADLGDEELAHWINQELQAELWPETERWTA